LYNIIETNYTLQYFHNNNLNMYQFVPFNIHM